MKLTVRPDRGRSATILCRHVARLSLVMMAVGMSGMHADVAPRRLAQLQESATDIIVGNLTRLVIDEEPQTNGYTNLNLRYTVEVISVEKGSRISVGDEIEVLAWRWKERKRDEIGDHGHHPTPATGQVVRVYLSGRSVLHPNGFASPDAVDVATDGERDQPQSELIATDQIEPLLIDERIESVVEVPDSILFLALSVICVIVALGACWFFYANRRTA